MTFPQTSKEVLEDEDETWQVHTIMTPAASQTKAKSNPTIDMRQLKETLRMELQMGHTLHPFTVVENAGNVPVERVEMEGTETGMTPEAMLHYLLRIHGEQQRASLAIMESLERNTAAQEQRAYQEAGAAGRLSVVCRRASVEGPAPTFQGVAKLPQQATLVLPPQSEMVVWARVSDGAPAGGCHVMVDAMPDHEGKLRFS
ncbi:hypothetical protein AAFF_G00436610 [Aldrovandia affinis]|uniref:Uncharacterized protein n=1 Tax=Aldrovandia affinis TaxID=143900 RepID=A0AAD7WI01_9TELE|nr:hypothetical protein AAFF_G00436610 [Aldrovandia affinis]